MSDSPKILGALLHPDFELLDLYGPLEMFGCLGPADLRIVTVAQTAGAVKSSAGPCTLAAFDFEGCPALDLLLVPGGIGTLAELGNASILAFLCERCPQVEITMSVCTGSALLAKAGVLDGHRATSNKMFFDLAVSQSDQVEWISEARWVDDGRVVTASGVSAGTDMSLAVIERLFGKERAESIAVLTEYTRHEESNRDPFAVYLNKAAELRS